jgi:hypothetical protein
MIATLFSSQNHYTSATNCISKMNISKVIDYATLLKKLKHEFITCSPPPIDKKPHNDVQTFYPTNN